MIANILTDLRYAARAVRSRRGFAAAVILTLALGIGLNVAIFSLTDRILLRPLPAPEPDDLVNLTDPGPKSVGMASFPLASTRPSDSGGAETVFSYPMFRDLEREQEPLVGIAAHRFFQANLSTGDQPRLATGVFVSGGYFPVLGLRPAIGRLLGPEDDRVDGVAESVVLSHAYWQSEFDGSAEVLGRTLNVNGVPLTIVGVAPKGFHGTAVTARPSVFVPITISFPSGGPSPFLSVLPNHQRRNEYWVHIFGRLKAGMGREQAAAALNPLYRAILNEVEAPLLTGVDEQQLDAFRTRSLVLEPGAAGQTRSEILDSARNSLELMLAVSGGVLLLCCANVAGLILLRTTTRSGEMAVRVSIGATRSRLASLLLVESLVLALPATLLSLPVASITLRAASRVPGIPEAGFDVGLSAAAAFAAIGIALASALIVGLVPIRGLARTEPARTLQSSGTRQTSAKGVARFRAGVAAAQVALSMALLALTFVFAQSLANIARVDLGADIDSVVMVSVSPPPTQLTTERHDVASKRHSPRFPA